MRTLYDKEGNEIEVLEDEEITELKTKATEFETKNSEFETQKTDWETKQAEREEEITTLKGKLEGVEEKDFNFSKFRKAQTKEQDEMLKDFSQKEQILLKEISGLKGKIEDDSSSRSQSAIKSILDSLAGDDKNLREQISAKVSLFKDEATSQEEITEQYKNAFTIVKGEKPQVNSLNQFVPQATPGTDNKGEFADTEKGKDILNDCFPWAK